MVEIDGQVTSGRQALAASEDDQAELLEEERQIQEAIRLSMTEQNSVSPPARANRTGLKRKADEGFTEEGAKRPRSSAVRTDSVGSYQPGVNLAYPNGALRITRTPGRRNVRNCVNLPDLIHKDHLISACIFSFFIADEELFQHLPLSCSSHAVPASTFLQHKTTETS